MHVIFMLTENNQIILLISFLSQRFFSMETPRLYGQILVTYSFHSSSYLNPRIPGNDDNWSG